MRISDWSSDVCSSDLGIAAVKDVGIFGEKAENQPRHEMVHVRAALGDPSIGIVFQQLDIELVEAARGANVARTFAPLLDGADPGKWQEETRLEERRDGKECGRTCRYRWWRYHENKKKT